LILEGRWVRESDYLAVVAFAERRERPEDQQYEAIDSPNPGRDGRFVYVPAELAGAVREAFKNLSGPRGVWATNVMLAIEALCDRLLEERRRVWVDPASREARRVLWETLVALGHARRESPTAEAAEKVVGRVLAVVEAARVTRDTGMGYLAGARKVPVHEVPSGDLPDDLRALVEALEAFDAGGAAPACSACGRALGSGAA
jgi:hypothetical protein